MVAVASDAIRVPALTAIRGPVATQAELQNAGADSDQGAVATQAELENAGGDTDQGACCDTGRVRECRR